MATCPACQHDLDDDARRAGRCPSCGAALHSVAQRTIADIRTAKPTDDELERSNQTVEMPAGGLGESISIELTTPDAGDADESPSSTKTISDPPPLKTPLRIPAKKSGEPAPSGPKQATVTFGPEQTIEFSGSSGAIDESMLTSQWEANIPKGGSSGATIKQKETISGTYVSSSSLIVKSRHVTSTGRAPGARPISPGEAPDYELLNVIGEGGMGVVYAARQSSIARTVALKMLKSDDADLAQRDKFISEAVVTGELDHPNIVPIYDLGANDDGALFYSMKRVKGTPWHKVLRDKTLDENLNVLLRVADAVAFAHVNGVVHRDLKPENVMLGDFGEVLVMDWGLARVTSEFPNVAAVTQSDAMGGTPAYMAPEMATGPLDRITPASDIYLLGAILYEIITGKPPHTGKTVMQCLFAAAKNIIAPSDRSGELVDIALKAMSSKSELRHPSVQHFQGAVREYQAHAESLRLLTLARKHLDEGAAKQDYELYARAIYALEESLALWPGNAKSETLLAGARVDYARLALNKGDFDLGASLLNPAEESHRPVLAELDLGRRERESRQRRIKFLKGAVAALVASVVGIVSLAYFAVSKQRDAAVEARGLAERESERANVNYKNEQEARVEEAKQRTLAEQREKEAIVAREQANTERLAAVKARQDEAYAAYLARIGLTKVKLDENAFDTAVDLLEACPPELRNWEWGRLRFLTQLADRSWPAAAPVEAVAFAPDGAHFATGGWDGKAAIWSIADGRRLLDLPQGQSVHAVAYDAAGDRLAAAANDGTIVIYRVADGERIGPQLAGHVGDVQSVRFSPDGRRLLSCGLDNRARLWDLASGRQLQELYRHSWSVWAAEFSPDGRRIVTAGSDGQAIVWEQPRPMASPAAAVAARMTATPAPLPPAGAAASEQVVDYKILARFRGHKGAIFAARFSPKTGEIATAGADGRVLLWNPDDVKNPDMQKIIDVELGVATADEAPPQQQPYQELAKHRGPVRTLAFAPDGRTLASGGEDNTIIVWDLVSQRQLKQLRGHASHVFSCAFSPDGQALLSAGRDSQVKLWHPANYGETIAAATSDELGYGVLAARFSADGSKVVTASVDRTATLWDAHTLARQRQFQEGHQFLASAAAFYADGSRVATAAGDGTVRVWDAVNGAQLFRIDGTGYTAALTVSDDNQLIATASAGNELQIWDAATGKLVDALAGHNGHISAVRFAPGGRLLATGDVNGRCRLWRRNPQTGAWEPGAWLIGHSRTITALTFVDGGARLITASGDNTCGQWNVAAADELEPLVLKHPDWVSDVAASPDGQFAVTACDDGKVRLWSLADAQVLRTFETPNDKSTFTSIDVSPDGRLAVAVCAAMGTVQIWDLNSGAEISPQVADGGANPTTAPANARQVAAAPEDAKEQAGDSAQQPWLDLGEGSAAVWAARFAPHGDRLLTIGGNEAQLRNLDDHAVVVRFSPHGVVASADVSPDGQRVVTGSWDRTAKIWDAATGRVIAKLENLHAKAINSVCYSPSGDSILTASDDGTARLWNAADGAPLEIVLRGHEGSIHRACFSPDGSQILTAGDDHTARLWDARTGEQLKPLEGHAWAVLCATFSGDGKLIITGSVDNTAMVWDAASGNRIATLSGHTAGVTAVALSRDGLRALTGSQDNAAKLWDAKEGKEILTLAGHEREVTSASFSPDGLTALTSGRDNRILLWPAATWTSPTPR